MGILVAHLGYKVSTGTGWSAVSILQVSEIESLVCKFYLSAAAGRIVAVDAVAALTCCWDVKQPASIVVLIAEGKTPGVRKRSTQHHRR